MVKLYNTQSDFTSAMRFFLHSSCPHLRKTQTNIIPEIIWGMINAESSVSSDIANHLKGEFSLIQVNSITKRIRRFFNNKLFEPYLFYDSVIKFVISNYKKKHSDNNVHIIIDHMFSHDNYVVLMFSMRIGSQGVPIWFKCFKENTSDAYVEALIIEGIDYVSSIFDDSFNLIFLGDRWFNSTSLMEHINNLGHYYVFRLKKNIKVFVYDKKEKHEVWKWLHELTNYEWHSVSYKDVLLTDNKFKCNLVYSKRKDTADPWILVTNCDDKWPIYHYKHRFGGIESLFKNQKSNGFYIESVCNASEKSFTTMYTLVCFSVLFLTILGTEYTKNKCCYKTVKIETHKNYKNKGKVRILSLFNTGLTLFKYAINSLRYVRLPVRFILYDI